MNKENKNKQRIYILLIGGTILFFGLMSWLINNAQQERKSLSIPADRKGGINIQIEDKSNLDSFELEDKSLDDGFLIEIEK